MSSGYASSTGVGGVGGGEDEDDHGFDETEMEFEAALALHSQLQVLEATVKSHAALLLKRHEEVHAHISAEKAAAAAAAAAAAKEKKEQEVEISRKNKINEVAYISNKYGAEMFIQAKWREPELDGQTTLKSENINWDSYWKPKLFIANPSGPLSETITHTLKFDDRKRAFIVQKRRATGYYHQTMQLTQFPFDTQDLTITLTSERLDTEVSMMEDPIELSYVNQETFSCVQEWVLHKYMHVWKKVRTDENKQPPTTHPTFSAASKVTRRPQFFIWNILFVMCLICSMEFSTFAVALNLPQNRLQLSYILVLTTVSFKFVVNTSLPALSYLTYLDKYILSTMIILVIFSVYHSCVPVLNTASKCCSDLALWADTIALIVFSGVYTGFHLIFIMIIIVKVSETNMVVSANEMKRMRKGNRKSGKVAAMEDLD